MNFKLIGALSFLTLGCFPSLESLSTNYSGGSVTQTSSSQSSGSGGMMDAVSSSSSNSSSSSGIGGQSNQTSNQWVMGYYVGYSINQYPINVIDWTGITHIIFSPLTVNDDLSLNLSFDDQNGTGTQDAVAISSAAHSHGVKAILMLGGVNAGGNIAKAASQVNINSFVSSLISTTSSLGFDGLDLDWEDSVNLDDLVSLAQSLRAANSNLIITYPAGSINSNYQVVDPRMVTLALSLDRFNVQTYYPTTAGVGQGWNSWFNSPLSGVSGSTPIAIDDTLNRYASAGIPKNKLGMGMSFYAICYTGGITGPRQPTSNINQIVGGDNTYPLSAFFSVNSTFALSSTQEKQRDAVAQVPYLSLSNPINSSNCGATTQYISYDDEQSIIAKGNFSKSNGYGGIIIWTLQEGWLPPNAAENRSQNSLMQALKTGFINP